MSRMFQWPAVGVGLFFIATSMTKGLPDAIAYSSAGLNSAAEWTRMPSTPYALAIAA